MHAYHNRTHEGKPTDIHCFVAPHLHVLNFESVEFALVIQPLSELTQTTTLLTARKRKRRGAWRV